ncbi:site-specific integrase [Salmonella enterica]|nr:site-specific integrase [Salmonella enterica]
MPIFRRGNIWYCDYQTPDGKRRRRSLKTSDKKLAEELHDKLKYESWRIANLGGFHIATFEDACARWIKEKAEKKTLRDDKSRIAFWMESFAGKTLDEITEDKIYNAIENMTNRRHTENIKNSIAAMKLAKLPTPLFIPRKVATATKNTHLAFLKAMLRKAFFEWKWITNVPYIRLYPVKNNRVRWLLLHEAQRLIEVCNEPLKSVVEFALATGLRRSNIINMEWKQVDLARSVAWITAENSKTGKAIGIALNKTACSILERQKGNHPCWVFVHTKAKPKPNGEMTPSVRRMRVDDNNGWRLALARAGIEDFRFHDLRHTWASWLVQAGVPLFVLQEMGGWESLEMVKRYAHLSSTHLAEYACRLDEILPHTRD